ncbi:hypothetical protein C1H46_038173 [Malus baccata]|uniref:Cysteine proteinase inhibitor n=1 Tax=Malus baccata TaxID=106549 RepID=A0A540KQ25_MALBA|nr:hypothetical protein C1H46_038173 [Malus baccata]
MHVKKNSPFNTNYPPTYGVSPPPPRQSPYSVDHPVNRAPARFAVDEFNKETDAKLHLVRVVALEQPRWDYFHQLLTLEKLPTYGFLLPRPRPSPYPVDHHLIMAPARFAVDEINKDKNANLQLVRVVATFDRRSFEYFTQQLRLEVFDEGVAKIYGAQVKRKSGSSDMRLVVFYEVGNPS